MILQHAILALLLVGGVAVIGLSSAVPHALAVLRHWDLASGSALQLKLERRTTLVSATVALLLVAQGVALLLFVRNADRMAASFVGAMCAVGTLQANRYGFPALYAQVAGFFLSAAWLTLHRVDVRSPDYPLTRAKHGLLFALIPVAALSFGLELAYFANLRADVITSCCGSLFSADPRELPAELGGWAAAWAPASAIPSFFVGMAAVVAVAALVGHRGRGGAWLGVAGAAGFVLALAAVISFVSLYVYEDPQHHCPFCLLKPDYGYVGYAIYVPLFGATAAASGALALSPFAGRPALAARIAAATRRLALASGALYAAVIAVVAAIVLRSPLVLLGVGS
jgi:hypothetical protein